MASLSEDEQNMCVVKDEENSTKTKNENGLVEDKKSKCFDASFSTQTWREDMSLVVQGNKHLYVASTVLSLLSPVFNTMFEEAFGDGHPREIELKEKSHDDMVVFLQCLYPNIQKDIDIDNVFVVLPLAVEFDTKLLKERCETFLLSQLNPDTNAEGLCQYLIKASTFSLADVTERCICLLSDKNYEELLMAENKFPLPLDAKVEIQHRVIKSRERLVHQLRKTNGQYEKVLSKVDFKKVWFEKTQEKIVDFKNGCVGYLEYSSSYIYQGFRSESAAISIHGIDWSVGVREERGSLGVYLVTRVLPKQRVSWSCRVHAILLGRTFPLASELNGLFTETKFEWKFKVSKYLCSVDRISSVDLEIKFIVEEPTLKIDQ